MQMFFKKDNLSVKKTIELEEKLEKSILAEVGYAKTDKELAERFRLKIQEVNDTELSSDTEAALIPSDDSEYLGVIKVKSSYQENLFTCIHEIIHYVFDVGYGKPVSSTFERKKRGKTPDDHEQEINYLAASYSMPYDQMLKAISEYEKSSPKMDELKFVAGLCERYHQSWETVLRRIREVKRIAKEKKKTGFISA